MKTPENYEYVEKCWIRPPSIKRSTHPVQCRSPEWRFLVWRTVQQRAVDLYLMTWHDCGPQPQESYVSPLSQMQCISVFSLKYCQDVHILAADVRENDGAQNGQKKDTPWPQSTDQCFYHNVSEVKSSRGNGNKVCPINFRSRRMSLKIFLGHLDQDWQTDSVSFL